VSASITKEEDSAEEKKEEYLNRKQKQRLLRDATLREEDAHAALLIRSRNSKQLFIFVQPTVSRFSPEISFKMSHKKGTNSREIQAHHSFLLYVAFTRFFRSLSPRFDLSRGFFFLREVSVHHHHHRHLFSRDTF